MKMFRIIVSGVPLALAVALLITGLPIVFAGDNANCTAKIVGGGFQCSGDCDTEDPCVTKAAPPNKVVCVCSSNGVPQCCYPAGKLVGQIFVASHVGICDPNLPNCTQTGTCVGGADPVTGKLTVTCTVAGGD